MCFFGRRYYDCDDDLQEGASVLGERDNFLLSRSTVNRKADAVAGFTTKFWIPQTVVLMVTRSKSPIGHGVEHPSTRSIHGGGLCCDWTPTVLWLTSLDSFEHEGSDA